MLQQPQQKRVCRSKRRVQARRDVRGKRLDPQQRRDARDRFVMNGVFGCFGRTAVGGAVGSASTGADASDDGIKQARRERGEGEARERRIGGRLRKGDCALEEAQHRTLRHLRGERANNSAVRSHNGAGHRDGRRNKGARLRRLRARRVERDWDPAAQRRGAVDRCDGVRRRGAHAAAADE